MITKIKLILMMLCVVVAIQGALYSSGFNAGLKASDDEAFNAYTVMAKKMQHHSHKHQDVFAKAGF
jgi:hypothetical protein